ncbi:MAG: CerR family C-terminal domain-containing protein [Planctomycetes bacterium]|nr:CerR family C-terminal domain-containing protein [Planctomycetota bacterium]
MSADTATRQRLLDAAAEVFARRGFASATIREICTEAQANVAAVNYHFRDKAALYEAVLDHGYMLALQKYPPDGGLPTSAPDEQKLLAFVRSFLQRLLSEGPWACHGKLMARELSEPTGMLDKKVEQHVRPLFKLLSEILRAIAGPELNDAALRRCARSVVGQILFYRHAQPVLQRLEPELKYNAQTIDQLAQHIADFSVSALRALARRK